MGADAPRYTGRREPWAMLSTAEASKSLGQPVAAVEQMGITTGEYHFGAGGSGRLPIQYTWEGGAHDAQTGTRGHRNRSRPE